MVGCFYRYYYYYLSYLDYCNNSRKSSHYPFNGFFCLFSFLSWSIWLHVSYTILDFVTNIGCLCLCLSLIFSSSLASQSLILTFVVSRLCSLYHYSWYSDLPLLCLWDGWQQKKTSLKLPLFTVPELKIKHVLKNFGPFSFDLCSLQFLILWSSLGGNIWLRHRVNTSKKE